MRPLPLDIPPGIVKVQSENAAGGRFVDCDKIRFVDGKAEKWLGWNKLIDEAIRGKARGCVSWSNSFGNRNAAFGTNLKLYALLGNDTIEDITPIRATATLGENPFETTEGSTEVIVSHTAHGVDEDAFVTFSGATEVGGITLEGEYQLNRIDTDSYVINHSVPATSSATGGGDSVQAEYQINPGPDSTVGGTGWGAGRWGEGTWGTEREGSISIEFRYWSLQAYGHELLANPSRDSLFLWEQATDERAELVTNAPSSVRAMFVTSERFIFLLGTLTPMTVQWPDQDDPTDYVPSSSNTANIRRLQDGSKLMNGVTLTDGVSLIWSDTATYLFQYTGGDLIYDSRLAGEACGLISPQGFAKSSGVAYWMSPQGFHMYAGGVQIIPNSEHVRAWMIADMDPNQVAKTWAMYDQKNHQVRWGYCSKGADEPDRYVDVSLHDFSWTVGTLDRTTGTVFRPSDGSSLMVDHDGYIHSHDEGHDADGEAMNAWIKYSLFALSEGDQLVDIMELIPDFERQTGPVDFEIYTRDRPKSRENFDEQTITIEEDDILGELRISGRHFGMIVRSNVRGGDFRQGIHRLGIGGAGKAGGR